MEGKPVARAEPSMLQSRSGLILLGFIVVALVLLFTEHRVHVLGVLVWVLPFACVVMHLFMHRGHGGHHRKEGP